MIKIEINAEDIDFYCCNYNKIAYQFSLHYEYGGRYILANRAEAIGNTRIFSRELGAGRGLDLKLIPKWECIGCGKLFLTQKDWEIAVSLLRLGGREPLEDYITEELKLMSKNELNAGLTLCTDAGLHAVVQYSIKNHGFLR